jgi:spore germination protein GerM
MSSERRKRVNISLLIPFLVIALVFGLLIWQKYQSSREVPPMPQVQQPEGERKAVLFFVAEGSRLMREARNLESCDNTDACVKAVLDELFNGPVGDLDEALPEGAAFNGVRIEGNTAVVDLNRSFADELPAGSSAEMLAVYSIVDTICVNFPQIAKVKLTIDGKGDAVLEHLDLSEPFTPDYALEQGTVSVESGKSSHTSPPTTKKGHP